MKRNMQDYVHIIDNPHYQSVIRPHMARGNRAAQFAPFAALTGYDDAVKEMARWTDKKIEIDEMRAALLNERLCILQEQAAANPFVEITYFRPDEKKAGGAYVTAAGTVRKIDLAARVLIFTDRTTILMDDIFDIRGDLFPATADL